MLPHGESPSVVSWPGREASLDFMELWMAFKHLEVKTKVQVPSSCAALFWYVIPYGMMTQAVCGMPGLLKFWTGL